jgi:uncharacterized membrane protein YhhN
MKTKAFTALYFLTGFQYILSQYYTGAIPDVLVKALIIPILMLILWTNMVRENRKMNIIMFAALTFSWAGDIALEFTSENGNIFILGLVFFLLAHIMYLVVFLTTPGKSSILSNRIYLLIPVLVFGFGLVYFLYNDLGDMRIPVILYAVVILLMLTGAINRIEKVNRKSYWLVLAGAILFVISDSAIAVNKFSMPFKASSIVIMTTYIIAQYLIVQGYIYQYRKN